MPGMFNRIVARLARRLMARREADVVIRRAAQMHRVRLMGAHATTLFITGPKFRNWGFMTDRGWVHWSEYLGPLQPDRSSRCSTVFERMLVDDGILLFKYWLSVDQQYQEERFAERAQDPLKRWKLSPIDLQSRASYEDYGRARDAMFEATHTRHAPWCVVDFNDQKRGRLNLIRNLLDRVPDCQLPEEPFDLPPLAHKPRKERFTTALKPLRNRF
ncbi:MAG TPA: hypothetical protein PLW13_13380 [Pseudomonadales bacterium]|nr:hypothetical protein [Pseudomonadales bacterium]